jgi:hypothetical protein
MKTKIELLQLKDKLDMMSQEYRDAHIELTDVYLEEYTILKYKQELELKEFKNQYKSEIADLIQEIRENGISKQNIETRRVEYEKDYNSGDFTFPNRKEPSDIEKAEIIYDSLIKKVTDSKSNNKYNFIYAYENAKDTIIKYYQRYFEIKNEIDRFKQKQSVESKNLTSEIKDNGIPIYIIVNTYRKVRVNKSSYDISPRELEYVEELYNRNKDKLLEIMNNIKKD